MMDQHDEYHFATDLINSTEFVRATVNKATFYKLNGADLDDLTQQTLLQAWAARHSFRKDSRLSTWLHTIARRAAYNASQRGRRISYVEETPEVLDPTDPCEVIQCDELINALQHRYSELTATQQRVVDLRYSQGLNARQIAAKTATPLSTVSRWYRSFFET
jgi:RNA polymerase sigma factor (sigma-70 family)